MPTSWNTHDYDGQLRDKWFELRPMLIENHLPNCLSFDDTIKEIEQWLDQKYFNVKRIGRAHRALRILATHRKGNFDSRNEIDVEELLPILWDKVKRQKDIYDTFYEQLCDITGGSCSQGRSTRLFQFLFLFDMPLETSKAKEDEDSSTKGPSEPVLDQDSTVEDKEQSLKQSEPFEKPVPEVEQQANITDNTDGTQSLEKKEETSDAKQINSSPSTQTELQIV